MIGGGSRIRTDVLQLMRLPLGTTPVNPAIRHLHKRIPHKSVTAFFTKMPKVCDILFALFDGDNFPAFRLEAVRRSNRDEETMRTE